ncbi:hypothetical protein [Cognatishimia sp. F0-27]|uniref:hypothetical protein n=1 Tax=Cognatishimia sp. F0-27 TaxID=2816855 RepID=UPI001D0C2EC9|nr:hypothetical protein [Cognatishimia sp. F0-27]MCC1494503.1 hypothetical protein [Cognatishimia sp. F0-27]
MIRKHGSDFHMGKALLLAAAIVLGLCVGPVQAAQDLRMTLENRIFLADVAGQPVEARFLTQGRLVLETPTRQTEGHWYTRGDRLCLALPNGETAQLRCHVLAQIDATTLQSDNGVTLVRIAAVPPL